MGIGGVLATVHELAEKSLANAESSLCATPSHKAAEQRQP